MPNSMSPVVAMFGSLSLSKGQLPQPVMNALRRIDKGLRIVLKPFQIVSNFILLSVAYFLGVGLSSIFYRVANKSGTIHSDSYWQEVPPAPKDRDSWLRPF